MAIDTATKRFSIIDFGDFIGGIPSPPDGAIDQGDRQTFIAGYSGVLYGAPVQVTLPEVSFDVMLAFSNSSTVGIDMTSINDVIFSFLESFDVRF